MPSPLLLTGGWWRHQSAVTTGFTYATVNCTNGILPLHFLHCIPIAAVFQVEHFVLRDGGKKEFARIQNSACKTYCMASPGFSEVAQPGTWRLRHHSYRRRVQKTCVDDTTSPISAATTVLLPTASCLFACHASPDPTVFGCRAPVSEAE
ncbi:hypothetical protein Vretimale_17072 [Volvox reticuliferus]|uniref:Uncharacterized protein n=1 Tax=Volvox reticuliferus TaxID=1737510 RepID=A0A8J4CXJ4_9CHLO|nr:hypothetical protein Vretifemale_18682 [Volvox reticuliferus]GIM14045.1 hypothetical protein Vretimale_17072 [Volvox reticuliferus]